MTNGKTCLRGHVLKPETTKRNGRNETTETTETSETAETKPPKRPKQAKINEKLKLKNTTFILHQLYPRVWHRGSQILAGPVKMNEHNIAGRARRHREKAGYFHILNGIMAKTRNIIF